MEDEINGDSERRKYEDEDDPADLVSGISASGYDADAEEKSDNGRRGVVDRQVTPRKEENSETDYHELQKYQKTDRHESARDELEKLSHFSPSFRNDTFSRVRVHARTLKIRYPI